MYIYYLQNVLSLIILVNTQIYLDYVYMFSKVQSVSLPHL